MKDITKHSYLRKWFEVMHQSNALFLSGQYCTHDLNNFIGSVNEGVVMFLGKIWIPLNRPSFELDKECIYRTSSIKWIVSLVP